MSKMTGAQAVYEHLKSFKDGTCFTRSVLNSRLPGSTPASINSAVYKMVHAGVLKQNNDGSCTVTMQKMLEWGDKKKWKAPYTSTGGVRAKKKAPPTDGELIENMFAAVQAAEPAIRKLQDTAKVLKNLYGDQ